MALPERTPSVLYHLLYLIPQNAPSFLDFIRPKALYSARLESHFEGIMTDKRDPEARLFRPFQFILQEGSQIKKDLMDFRLVMLDLRCREVLHSPARPIKKEEIVENRIETDRLIAEMEVIARRLEQAQTGPASETPSETPPSSE